MENDINTQINILKIMYQVVKPLSSEIIYCANNEDVTIVNSHGIEVMKGNRDSIRLFNRFIIQHSNSSIYIYCFSTNKKMELKSKSYRMSAKFEEAGSSMLAIYSDGECAIINENLDIIFKIKSYSVRIYSDSKGKIRVYYRTSLYVDAVAIINEATSSVDCYDSFELCDCYSLVGTEYTDTAEKTINKRTIDNIRYKLARYGVVVSSKSYSDILKPPELTHTNTFYTFRGLKGLKGLLREDGVELLDTIYDDIKYIGNNNYLLELNVKETMYASIYNSINGVVLDFKDLLGVEIHRNLPLVVLYLANMEVKLLSIEDGSMYNVSDITKHFKCSYNKKFSNIIRVELDYGNKYITNNLVAITNLLEISKLTAEEWVPM